MKKKSALPVIGILVLSLIVVGIVWFSTSPYKLSVIWSGSMEPQIMTNSVIVIDSSYPFEDVQIGDVIRYNNGELSEDVVHQVVRIENLEVGKVAYTKGINNENYDPWPVTAENYHGRFVKSFNSSRYFLNLFFGNLRTMTTAEKNVGIVKMIVSIFAVLAVIFVIPMVLYFRKKKNKEVKKYEK